MLWAFCEHNGGTVCTCFLCFPGLDQGVSLLHCKCPLNHCCSFFSFAWQVVVSTPVVVIKWSLRRLSEHDMGLSLFELVCLALWPRNVVMLDLRFSYKRACIGLTFLSAWAWGRPTSWDYFWTKLLYCCATHLTCRCFDRLGDTSFSFPELLFLPLSSVFFSCFVWPPMCSLLLQGKK